LKIISTLTHRTQYPQLFHHCHLVGKWKNIQSLADWFTTGSDVKRSDTDQVSSKLAALQFYQLAIPPPKAPEGSYNHEAANRGQILFSGKAKCASCHVPPLFAEPGWSTHKAEEICIDDFQSNRSPYKTYVTQGLGGLWAHSKGGFYHEGRFATLLDVVNHYDDCKKLNLSESEKNDLVEYLKSL
jgi:cytochrome c peroxidase